MQICRISIENFRGIKHGIVDIDGHTVFVGDNNSGKSTVFEAIDLVMGPERLNRHPVIDEHDFYAGEYYIEGVAKEITIEVIVIDLSEEQRIYFGNHIEWWNTLERRIIDGPPASATDEEGVVSALRLKFVGRYDFEEDDFAGQTLYSSSLREGGQPTFFTTKDKRMCGFLYLRTLRTGKRALSLERGSLLDIILKLREMHPQMWEKVISQLKEVSVAADPELGINEILSSVQTAISSLVTYETANEPHIKVSNLTREHLRSVLTVFLGSGEYNSLGEEYSTPYYRQGTGTINTLVLALLSIIAEAKENVIFAMEEPEIALPPHVQKRVVLSVIEKSNQALFTSHSPYVLEEFHPDNIAVLSRASGTLCSKPAKLPPTIRLKKYREEMKRRLCEGLLSRRVLITEGKTEYDVYRAASRKLQEEHPESNLSLELLGVSLFDAESETKIAGLAEYFKSLGKTVFAVFDKQSPKNLTDIVLNTDRAFEASEKGIENVVLKGIPYSKLLSYGIELVENGEWPNDPHMKMPYEGMLEEELYSSLFEFFKKHKGDGALADLVSSCNEEEMPKFIVDTIYEISRLSAENRQQITEDAISPDYPMEDE